MKRFKTYSLYVVCLILSVAVLMPRLQQWIPEDITHDGVVGLEDIVLSVRNLSRSAEHPDSFKTNASLMISALRMLSGAKNIIKSEQDEKLGAILEHYNAYLVSFNDYQFKGNRAFYRQLSSGRYQSANIDVPVPPPKVLRF